MSPTEIDLAFERHLLTLPDAPSIAWDGVRYTPTIGQAYLQVNFLRNTPIDHAETLDVREDRGILQVTVVHPAGRAARFLANTLAQNIADHFAIGTRLLLDGGAVTVYKSPAIGSGYADEGWYRVPVSISWTTA